MHLNKKICFAKPSVFPFPAEIFRFQTEKKRKIKSLQSFNSSAGRKGRFLRRFLVGKSCRHAIFGPPFSKSSNCHPSFPRRIPLRTTKSILKDEKTNWSHTSFNLDWSWSSPHVDLSWIISQLELRTLQVYPSAHQQTKVVRLERSDRAPDGEEGADQGSTSPGSRLSPQVEGHFFHLPWIIGRSLDFHGAKKILSSSPPGWEKAPQLSSAQLVIWSAGIAKSPGVTWSMKSWFSE